MTLKVGRGTYVTCCGGTLYNVISLLEGCAQGADMEIPKMT